jgi:hypothetical protein
MEAKTAANVKKWVDDLIRLDSALYTRPLYRLLLTSMGAT